jgi:HSP20 family protein
VKNELKIEKRDSLWEELDKIREHVTKRAYDLFIENGGQFGRDLDDWLKAEQELIWKPAIDLAEENDEFVLKIAIPGVDPKALDIEVTPDDLLVKAETRSEQKDNDGLHICELNKGNLFRAIRFPKRIVPDRVKTEFKNGLLTIRAAIAQEAQAKKISVEAS